MIRRYHDLSRDRLMQFGKGAGMVGILRARAKGDLLEMIDLAFTPFVSSPLSTGLVS